MLKIKDNVDLKELEKYGLEFYDYEEDGLKFQSYMLDDESTQIVVLDEIENIPRGHIYNPEEYKSRNNEAIKFVDNHMQHHTGMNCGDMNDLLDILQGCDE